MTKGKASILEYDKQNSQETESKQKQKKGGVVLLGSRLGFIGRGDGFEGWFWN